MPVRRDKNGRYYFRTVLKHSDGTRERAYGMPGQPGPYHDLVNSKLGAQEAERRAIADALRGKPIAQSPAQEAPKHKTIAEHAEGFVDTYKPGSKPGEKREKRRILKTHLVPYFGAMTIEGLKQEDVDGFARGELERGNKVKTVNNYLAVLSTLIKYRTGVKSKLRFKLDGMTGELAPVAPDDVERLLVAADDPRYRAVILLASEAGLRAGEIRGLQQPDVVADVVVRRALDKLTNEMIAPKHNKMRSIPKSPRLADALAALPRRGLWVISESDGRPVSYDDLSRTMNAIYDRAGVPRPAKPLHALRHTFGTVMARRVPLPVLQKLLGHSDVKTTLRYVDVAESDKRDAIALVFGAAVAARGSD